MKWSINAGSIFGIKLRIHITFFLLPLFVFASDINRGLKQAVLAVLFVCAIFACVVIHELAHSLVARRFGREPRSITLLPIGGVATIDRMPTKPAQEIVISIVGPATNILIAIALALVGGFSMAAAFRNSSNLTASQLFIRDLFAANIVLAVFNLIPALPMDGGRVLRGLLAMKMNYLRATLLAVSVGKVIAVLFILLGLRYDMWLAMIGFFIYSGANSERQQAIMQTQFIGTQPGEATTARFANLEQDEEIIRRQSDGF
jgi:Zn-dependent protease